MEDFRDYKVLLRSDFFDRYESYLSSKENNVFANMFNIEKIKIEDNFFSVLTARYNEGSNLFIDKKKFNISFLPQLFELKTEGEIYNFIDKSHFMTGFIIALHFFKNYERLFFIDELRSDNLRHNPPSVFVEKIRFALMCSEKFMSKILIEYNKLYNTNFTIVEVFFLDGEEFCVFEVDRGSSLDLFCLGSFSLLTQLQNV